MKLFLGNVPPDDSYTIIGYKTNLDNACENNECVEIYAPDILDFVEVSEHRNLILHFLKKLRHGGYIYVGGTDIVMLSLGIFNKQINLDSANKLIFGTNEQPKKNGLTCLEEIRKIFLSTELVITKQTCNTLFGIGARRP